MDFGKVRPPVWPVGRGKEVLAPKAADEADKRIIFCLGKVIKGRKKQQSSKGFEHGNQGLGLE